MESMKYSKVRLDYSMHSATLASSCHTTFKQAPGANTLIVPVTTLSVATRQLND